MYRQDQSVPLQLENLSYMRRKLILGEFLRLFDLHTPDSIRLGGELTAPCSQCAQSLFYLTAHTNSLI